MSDMIIVLMYSYGKTSSTDQNHEIVVFASKNHLFVSVLIIVVIYL